MTERVQALLRLGAMLLAFALVLLIAFGVLDANAFIAAVAVVLKVAADVVAWWKNNNMTDNAQQSQKYKNHLDSMGSE